MLPLCPEVHEELPPLVVKSFATASGVLNVNTRLWVIRIRSTVTYNRQDIHISTVHQPACSNKLLGVATPVLGVVRHYCMITVQYNLLHMVQVGRL